MALFEDVEYFIRNIATNFDCDSDAHRYKTYCRCCEAEKLLAQLKGEPGCADGNPCYRKGCLSCFCHGNIKYLSYEQAIVQDGERAGKGCGYDPALAQPAQTPPIRSKEWFRQRVALERDESITAGAPDPATTKKPAYDASIYDDKFAEVREKWIAWYFSWVEQKDISEQELHTARDGFDAGANWHSKKAQNSESIISALQKLSDADREKVLAHFRQ